MNEMRSVGRMLRLRAQRGAAREELEVELRGNGIISDVERTVLEAYVWALVRVPARVPDAEGERGDPGP